MGPSSVDRAGVPVAHAAIRGRQEAREADSHAIEELKEMKDSRWMSAAVAAMVAVGAAGCAQEVGDIDRTQPNRLAKKDLEGVWYFKQTVTDAPTAQPRFSSRNVIALSGANCPVRCACQVCP